MATPIIVAQTSATTISGATISCAIPAGAQESDLLLIFVSNDRLTLSGNDADSGFSLVAPENGQMVFARSSTTPDANLAVFSVSLTAGQTGNAIVKYVDIAAASVALCVLIRGASDVDVANIIGTNAETASTTSITVPSITTTRENCLAFYVATTDGTDMDPFTVPSGWTLLAEIDSGITSSLYTTLAVGYKEMPAAGDTGDITIETTTAIADGWMARQFAIDEALIPIEIRETLNDAGAAPYPSGTPVFAYNADGSLYTSTTVGAKFGYRTVDTTAAGAGEVVLTFKPGMGTAKFLVRGPSVDSDGLVTQLVSPA